jgi:hypothetical protein
MKIFTNYFQIIQAITSYPSSLPQSLVSTMQNVGNPVQAMAVSYDCFFLSFTDIEVVYFRMIWALVMPGIYLAVFLFAYFVAVLLKKIPYKTSIIYTTFIYMFIYLQPTLLGGYTSINTHQVHGARLVQEHFRLRVGASRCQPPLRYDDTHCMGT